MPALEAAAPSNSAHVCARASCVSLPYALPGVYLVLDWFLFINSSIYVKLSCFPPHQHTCHEVSRIYMLFCWGCDSLRLRIFRIRVSRIRRERLLTWSTVNDTDEGLNLINRFLIFEERFYCCFPTFSSKLTLRSVCLPTLEDLTEHRKCPNA